MHPSARISHGSSQRGFTLIELLFTVVILAILAALAGPPFGEMIARQKLRAAASALTDSLWLARSEAIARNTDVGYSFTNIGNGWSVKAGATVLHTQEPMTAVTSSGANFQFNAQGRLQSGVGNLELGNMDGTVFRCVTITLSAKVSAKDGKCS